MRDLPKTFDNYWAARESTPSQELHIYLPSIRHLHISHNAPYLPPKKFCITFAFHFSWVLQLSQEKLKTMLMAIFGGKEGALWQMCKWRMSKKDKMADRTSRRLCMSHSPFNEAGFFAGRGRVISGRLANWFGSLIGTNTTLLRGVIDPIRRRMIIKI